jgi:hypothetical protein
MLLLWQRSEEKVFITDVSLNGMFVRTSIMPPHGSSVTLLVPNSGTQNEAVRVEATVVRIARRGDPANPLGGIGISWERIVSRKGTVPVIDFLNLLFGNDAPKLEVRPDPVSVAMPVCDLRPLVEESDEAAVPEITEIGFDQTPATADLAVFCRWRNMVIQARLVLLGNHQAILTGLRVLPVVGDEVTVRLISSNQTMFRGLEFTGLVDLIKTEEAAGGSNMVRLAIAPMNEQRERGGLRTLLEQLAEKK